MKTDIKALLAALSVAVCLSATISQAATRKCKEDPTIVDKCFTVHGRMFFSNGTPSLRILKLGSKRILGVVPSEAENIPEDIEKAMTPYRRLYADFLVCPHTKEQEHTMQNVCVESATNVVIEELDETGKVTRSYRLK